MKVLIEDSIHQDAICIWFYESDGKHVYVMKPMIVEMVELSKKDEYCQRPEPSLTISRQHSKAFLEGLAEALAEKGIAKSNEKVAGLYQAQTDHLKDLQKLVFQTNYILKDK